MRRGLLKGLFIGIVAIAVNCSCGGEKIRQETSASEQRIDTSKTVVKYANGFDIKYMDNWISVSIKDPQKDTEGKTYNFALVDKKQKNAGNIPSDYTVIGIPVERVICMTSLQLSNFIKLDACEKVVGITSSRHLFNKEMNERVESGKTVKIGMEGAFDEELVLATNPDIVFISPFKRGGYDKIKELDQTMMPHLGYKETSPLAQAEWIKLVGLLIGKTSYSNEVFNGIEEEYNKMKELASRVEQRPLVFSGEIRGGNWYAVGGKSYLAQLFRDAGADYFLKDDNSTGGKNLDFEVVYSQADKCDFWRILNSYEGEFTYSALLKEDPRYADFKAFKNKGVLYCNMKYQPFYESTPVEPEVVLKDFIKAFHPEILPDYQPVYYRLLAK